MFNTCLTLSRGTRRLSTLALTGAALLLTACDSDSPLEPKALPTEASLARISTGGTSATLVMRLVDQNNNPLPSLAPSAKFTVELKGKAPMDVVDNGKRDADLTVGIVRVTGLDAGTYIVCQTATYANRVLPARPCTTKDLVAGRIGSLDFVNLAKARIRWTTKDYVGNLIGGMEFSWNNQAFTDNQAPDIDPTPGEVEIQVDVEGWYTVCQVEFPAGYLPLPQQMVFCFSKELKHGEVTDGGNWMVMPEFSAYWDVSSGVMDANFNLIPIGGATFTITGSADTITVVDNGANDFDLRVGRLAVKLSGEGSYTICQTVVPTGYSAPNPACKNIEVFGEPVHGGWFINPAN